MIMLKIVSDIMKSMTYKLSVKLALLLLLILVPLLQSCDKEEAKPNFVFILVDDLGWTDLGSFGSTFYETPNIDRLAAQGVRFTDAYAACPVCSPTRASIMTGKYPSRVNITDWIPGDDPGNRQLLGTSDSNQLDLSETSLAEALGQHGYNTFFAGKWHLGNTEFFPEYQGFDINIGGHHRGSPPGGYYSPYKNPKLTDGPEGEYLTDRLTEESINFLKANGEDPFLLYLSFYNVHTPIQENLEYIDYYKAKKSDLGEEGTVKLTNEHKSLTVLNQVNPAYGSMVAIMDLNVGRIIDYLRETGLDKNTYVIFTSDNGGLSTITGNRVSPTSVLPLRAGKGWCYEGGIRVPLIIYGPGIENGVSDFPVISTDFYPTILEMAGLPLMPDQHIDGISLNSIFDGKLPDRDVLFWHYPHYHSSGWTPGAAIRRGDWKLVHFYENQVSELYNLKDDIGETNDLSEKYPDILRELEEELEEMQIETGAILPVPNPDYNIK
jgi:arylsulfatase A-like enzyme